MEFYQDRISKLLKELRESLACNFDNEQIERLNVSLQQFGSALKNVTENISLQFLNEEWLTYKETLDGIVEGRLRHDKD